MTGIVTFAAFMVAYLSRRSIMLCGALGILASSAMFLWNDKRDQRPVGTATQR